MRKTLRAVITVITLSVPIVITNCTVHAGVGYRVYDPYYSDYHVWDDAEVGHYHRWAADTHRDPNRDFRKLNKNEQHEYWTWRHGR